MNKLNEEHKYESTFGGTECYANHSEDTKFKIRFMEVGGKDESRMISKDYYTEPHAILVVLKAGEQYKMYESTLYRAKKFIKEVDSYIHPEARLVPLELVLLHGKDCSDLKEVSEFCHDRNFCIH